MYYFANSFRHSFISGIIQPITEALDMADTHKQPTKKRWHVEIIFVLKWTELIWLYSQNRPYQAKSYPNPIPHPNSNRNKPMPKPNPNQNPGRVSGKGCDTFLKVGVHPVSEASRKFFVPPLFGIWGVQLETSKWENNNQKHCKDQLVASHTNSCFKRECVPECHCLRHCYFRKWRFKFSWSVT